MNETHWYKFSYERVGQGGVLAKNSIVFSGISQEEATAKATEALKRVGPAPFRFVDVKVWHPHQIDAFGGGKPPPGKS